MLDIRTISFAACAAALAIVGCGSPIDEEAAGSEAAVTASDQDFKVGDRVTTTGNLNLRGSPSTSGAVLAVMPRGTTVTVTALPTDPASTGGLSAGALDSTPDETTPDPGAVGGGAGGGGAGGGGAGGGGAEDTGWDGAPSTPPRDDLPLPPIPPARAPAEMQGNPTGGFWYVTYGSRAGWASGRYLTAEDGEDGDTETRGASTGRGSTGASSCMSRVAGFARARNGYRSGSRCYHVTKEHIGNALGVGFTGVQSLLGAAYQVGASDFARWVAANPGGRASSAGFVETRANLEALPEGAILVWAPGQCGYSAMYGHIEINIGGGRACSDYCGTIRRNCGAPRVIEIQRACGGGH